jgi:hypothetical protein
LGPIAFIYDRIAFTVRRYDGWVMRLTYLPPLLGGVMIGLAVFAPPGWIWLGWLTGCTLFVVLGVILWRLRHGTTEEHRFARGFCLACGYDLRGRNQRCPECGRAVDPRLG